MALKVGVDGKFLNAVNTHYDTYNRTTNGYEFYLYGTGKTEDEVNDDGTKYRADRVGTYTYSGGNAWRSYTPDAYNYTSASNPDEWGAGNVSGERRNGRFLYAQGKLFVGAPLTDVGTTDRGAVTVIFPHRMKSGLSTDFQDYDLPATVSNTYGKHWSLFTASESESSMEFGWSLAFTRGQLFVSAPFKNDNYTNEGRIYRYTGDYTYGTPTETKYDAGTIGDNGGLDFSNFANNQEWGSSMSAANGVLCVGDDLGNAYITHLARRERSEDSYLPDWIKIVAPLDEQGNAGSAQGFGFNVKVGCGRVIIVSRYYATATTTNAGAFHIYDYYGNHIRTVTNPDGASLNGQFAYSTEIGSGRIVCSGRAGFGYRDFFIFDLDGELIKKVSASTFTPFYDDSGSLAVGFGRIACVSGYADVPSNNNGEAALFDLDGNRIGMDLLPCTSKQSQTLGVGGLAIGPGRLYALASAHASSGSVHASIQEWPIHTSMTKWDVEAMEDGDV